MTRRPDKLLNDIAEVVFEADTVRQWVSDLALRTERALERAEEAGLKDTEWKEDLKELHQAKASLTKTRGSLRIFEGMVARRENFDDES
jgi:hypothetical protein